MKNEAPEKIKTGLCSITFRKLTVPQIISLVQKAGLDAIEWGSDVHVPEGDERTAKNVRERMSDAGLLISSYGSYFRIFDEADQEENFSPVLDSALTLGTDTIRIWAGRKGSNETSEYELCRLAERAVQIADQAATGSRFIGGRISHINFKVCGIWLPGFSISTCFIGNMT